MASLSSTALPGGNPNPERTEFDALPMFSRRDPEADTAESFREVSMLEIFWVLLSLLLLPLLLLLLRKKAEEGGGDRAEEEVGSSVVSSSSRRRA